MQGLNWQTWRMPFVAGLNQKQSPRMLRPPELTIAKDVQYDRVGDLQTRYPYALQSGALDVVDGSTIAGEDVRKLVDDQGELLLFTKDKLYSRNVQLQKWVEKGTHLAIAVDERTILATTGDQLDADRAELDGTVFFCWTEHVGSTSKGYVAAIDKTTGNVLMPARALVGSAARLRLTALESKVLLSFYDGINGLYCYALDPASPATALGGSSTTLTNTSFGEVYDIVRVPGADMAVFATRQNPTTSYTIGTVTGGLAVASTSKSRDCDGPIAVSCSPDGTVVQVVRAAGEDVEGDLITIATLADVYTDQAIGNVPSSATIRHIAAAHRSVQDGGEYRCYATWSYNDGLGGFNSSGTKSNWADTGGLLGTQAAHVNRLGIASRSFEHDGRVFTWLVFGEVSQTTTNGGATPVSTFGALQNTYFLYRDDGFLCGKAAVAVAGASWIVSSGHLPCVQQVGPKQYAWCGIESRRVVEGAASTYGDRGPREITFEFDRNEARRVARLGRTLYITGAEILQYDGVQLTEVGFHVYPWQLDITEFPGTVPAANHAYKMTWRWDNARGERERSTTATIGILSRNQASQPRLQPQCQLNVTHKVTPAVAAEVWRTLTDPFDDSPYYLITSPDPTKTSTLLSNYYYANDVTAMAFAGNNDSMGDDVAATKETHPENGGVLESLAPPPATVIAANDTRIFLAGVSGDPDRVWYSKQRSADEIAAFHDALVVPIPAGGGAITGLAFLNEAPIVFRERAIYALSGDGFNNVGAGENYSARLISTDVGAVSQESIRTIDRGIVFKSAKGWYLLNRGWALEYIGASIVDYDNEEVLAVDVVEAQHQLRVLTEGRMLVLDTVGGQWFEWSIADGVHACMWQGRHIYLSPDGVKEQQTDYSTATYGIDVETAWIDLAAMQAFGRVRRFEVHGEYRSPHTVRVRCARDHWADGVDVYFDDESWTASPSAAGAPLELEHSPSEQQVNALKVRITLTPDGAGEAAKLSFLDFELGFKRGLFRRLPAQDRQ